MNEQFLGGALPTIAGADLQLGFVVADLDAAATGWTRDFGVGPFIHIETMGPLDAVYCGRPAPVVMGCAFGYLGNVQIELIQQRNDVASPYRDFLAGGREGLQHVGLLAEDYDGAEARLAAAGCQERFRIGFGAGSRDAVYYDGPAGFGAMIELIEASPVRRRRNAYMRDLAARWDGAQPIRRFASMAAVNDVIPVATADGG